MDLKHVKNGIEDGIVDILIYDNIGETYNERTNQFEGISGTQIAKEILFLNDIPEVKEINIRINSAGGSVVEGYSIFSSIKNSKKKINTYIDGIGASIAGIIFMAGDARKMVDFGRLMIHDPSIKSVLLSEAQRKMIESFRNSLLTILKNNSNLSDDALDSIMANETWLDPSEALSYGLVDDIISTDRKETESLSNEGILNLANEIKLSNYKQTPNKMKDLKNHFNLEAEATETEVLNSIKEVENKVEALSTENEALKTEIEKIKNDSETTADGLITKIATFQVENAIANGIFGSEKKESLIKQAKNDIDGFISIIDSLNKRPAKITNEINNGKKEVPSLRELEKTNPSEVSRLLNQEPETYKTMYKAEYGVEPNL